jgi:hypothetical protein
MVINFRIRTQTSTLIKKKLNENRFIYYYNIKNVSQLLKKTFSSFLKKRKKKKKGSCHKTRETEGRRSVAVRLNKKSALMVILIYKKAYPTQLTFNSWHGCMSGSACDLICHVFFYYLFNTKGCSRDNFRVHSKINFSLNNSKSTPRIIKIYFKKI